jgi:signal transduction histidine kinase
MSRRPRLLHLAPARALALPSLGCGGRVADLGPTLPPPEAAPPASVQASPAPPPRKIDSSPDVPRGAAARRDAELNQALLESERAYYRARELADRRLAQLADTSHDLRQPIAALRLAVDRLGFEGRTDEQHALQRALEYVENVLIQNLERATDKESSATDQTEEAADGATGEVEVFPVSLLLQSVEALFRYEAEAKGLQLRIVGSSLTISGALTPLLRIVCNLVSNAVRFTSEGKVLVGVLRRDGACEMVIADTGVGIAEADRDRLLQRSEKSEDSAGHGLGLAIAHRLASQNAVAITMSSTVGAGTCLRLRIP